LRIDDIEVVPLAAESMGVRSLCTHIITPSISIVLDPSAALSLRQRLEPHPMEYEALRESLLRIHQASDQADVLTASHYHFDHVRPGATNWQYNFSSKQDLIEMYRGKVLLVKDPREHINASQRRRGYYFQKDLREHVHSIEIADSARFSFGDTRIVFSEPLPHGPDGSLLGYVLACIVQHGDTKVVYAPDVQGPVCKKALDFILSSHANLAIVGGPPIYLERFGASNAALAQSSLVKIAQSIETLVVDHHLMRIPTWEEWLIPVRQAAEKYGHSVLSMAGLAGLRNNCLEAHRTEMYNEHPPSEQFMKWTASSDEYKVSNSPPISDGSL
jgi:predicted metallo-beta-lactamase superfamily hydrolase